MRGFTISLLLVFLFSFGVFAQTQSAIPIPAPRKTLQDITFGPEFTFYGDKTIMEDRYVVLNAFNARARSHLIDNQSDGAKFIFLSGQFQSPNGWNFTAKADPGVIEVVMTPASVEEFRKYAADIQDAIFVTAANEGIFPGLFVGGGHISINTEYLLENPMVYRNFLADLLVNHCELFMGVFGFDTNNAIPQLMMSSEMFDRLKMAFAQFDSRQEPTVFDIEVLIDAIRGAHEQYRSDPFVRYWNHGAPTHRSIKYVSVNQARVNTQNRLELRGVRPQASMDVWVRQIGLLRNRLAYLSTLSEPIPLNLKFKLNYDFNTPGIATQGQALTPPISAAEALTNFKKFVEESGERIEDHLDYVWPKWITDGDVQRFLSPPDNTCDEYLMR